MKIAIETLDISKSYTVNDSRIRVLDKLNFKAYKNDITVILGKSGCGKTTFLKLLASLEKLDEGEIIYDKKEKISIVFQEPRLMPWLNVYSNVNFGLKKRDISEKKTLRLIELVGLKSFEKAYPNQLSLGMQQRASIARALADDGSIILMDEPFASLDYFTRENMQKEVIKIYKEEYKSIIFVTHSIDEALIIGNRILIFEKGNIKKEYEILKESHPRNILSNYFIDIKKDILKNIKQN